MNRWPILIAAFLSALHAPAALAQEAYVTIDGFESGPINASRWTSFERDRTVGNNTASLVLREFGGTASDSGTTGLSWNQSVNLPQPINKMKAQVRVNGYEVGSCAANPATSRVRARVYGTYFNTGNPANGSFVGDVLAQIRVMRDSGSGDAPGVLRVEGLASLCTDSDCNGGPLIGPVQSLGTVNVGQNIVLQLDWDKANKKFIFARDNYAQTAELPYTLNDSIQPSRGFKSVGLRTDLENCASGPPVEGWIDARIDNVSVNSRARP